MATARFSRRALLRLGVVGGATAAVAGSAVAVGELVDHGVLPGRQELLSLTGACDVPVPAARFSVPGPSRSGTFSSAKRRRIVAYEIAWPPGWDPSSPRPLPLVVALHAYGADHRDALSGLSLAQALALEVGRVPLPPMAMVAADGGGGYWHAHPGDDPLGMVVDELIPMCRTLGLGTGGAPVGAVGISMGGYGALNLAEHQPGLVRAVAAISPAVWTTYAQAHGANPGAFGSAGEFAANDVVTHASRLRGVSVRVDSGIDDPFHPGVEALVEVLPAGSVVHIAKGCHGGPFARAAEPPALAFLGRHLA